GPSRGRQGAHRAARPPERIASPRVIVAASGRPGGESRGVHMQRVSGVDAAFLYGETPSWHMHVSAVLIADPSTSADGFSVQRLTRSIEGRLHLAPQFRWRLVDVPFGLGRPLFVEDPDFDIDRHIRRIGVPPPGGPEQLGNLIGELVGLKLDRSKPLWEFWVIDGLEDGRIALLAKIHHSIIVGVSGSELATILLDLEAAPPPAGPLADDRPVESIPNPWVLFAEGAWHTLATPIRLVQLVRGSVRQGLRFVGFQRREDAPPAPFQAP